MANREWGTGNGEQGMGNREQGTGFGEQGMGNGKRGTGNGEWGMGNGEWWTGDKHKVSGKWKMRGYISFICIIKYSLHHTQPSFKSIIIGWCLVINRFPPPSQHDDEPDAPLGAPPPYRLPPQPAVNISSPDGNNQYYPGSAQGDWWLGYSVVSRIFLFVSCWLSRVENRLDSTGECHRNVWEAQITIVFSLSRRQGERSWGEISCYNPLIPNIHIQILQTEPHTFP